AVFTLSLHDALPISLRTDSRPRLQERRSFNVRGALEAIIRQRGKLLAHLPKGHKNSPPLRAAATSRPGLLETSWLFSTQRAQQDSVAVLPRPPSMPLSESTSLRKRR